ncbi:MAG: sigma-54 dependent transcriptional regulator [Bdellovibrionia bacterium]
MLESHREAIGNILVVDDIEMQMLVRQLLSPLGHFVEVCSAGSEALELLSAGSQPDLIISDINMPGMDGMKFVENLKLRGLETPVVIMTAFGSIESAVQAMKAGAVDYLSKPFTPEALRVVVHRTLRLRSLETKNEDFGPTGSIGEMIGRSPQMQSVFQLVRRVSKSSANVLILGESGTGKEMVARAIHNEGPRSKNPFVAINCAAIPETLLESELFGHAKGSFTGAIAQKRGLLEEANGGTFFLDEIADMTVGLQAKLLRVLQDRKIKPVGQNTFRDINVRIIAATHKDLISMISNGMFREDLYYRLSVIPIVLPALRDRPDDIGLFAAHFLRKYVAMNGSRIKGFTREAHDKILSMAWEGNVRQLENTVERAVILCDESYIGVHHIYQVQPLMRTGSAEPGKTSSALSIIDMEKKCIQAALEKAHGKKERAAKMLGISRKTLYRKEREYGIAY